MIPRYAQLSNLVCMPLIGNFDIWEDFGMFLIEGKKRDQIFYRRWNFHLHKVCCNIRLVCFFSILSCYERKVLSFVAQEFCLSSIPQHIPSVKVASEKNNLIRLRGLTLVTMKNGKKSWESRVRRDWGLFDALSVPR